MTNQSIIILVLITTIVIYIVLQSSYQYRIYLGTIKNAQSKGVKVTTINFSKLVILLDPLPKKTYQLYFNRTPKATVYTMIHKPITGLKLYVSAYYVYVDGVIYKMKYFSWIKFVMLMETAELFDIKAELISAESLHAPEYFSETQYRR